MGCKIFCIAALFFFGFCVVDGRVFYVDAPGNLPLENYRIPSYPVKENEQASRDLDLSFSAGDSEEKNLVYPVKKVYAYATPERPIYEVNREFERPAPYYKVADIPSSRRIVYDDQLPISERNRKLVRLNNGQRKGELVLELRVIANNNNAI